MKRIFQYISIFLLLIVAGSGCQDNDNWKIISALQEGVYVAGDATVYSTTASAAALGIIYLDPADQDASHLSAIFTWVKTGSTFHLVSVDAEGNQKQLGAGAEVSVSGTDGKTYSAAEGATITVPKDGFYCIIYNNADNQISVIEYVMTIIGDATPGKWDNGTPMSAPTFNEATSTVEYTLSNVALNNKEIKFRVGNNWQYKIPYGSGTAQVAAGYGPETAMDFPESSTECSSKPGLPNFKVAKAGLYDITLNYELRNKKFMGKGVYKGENPDQPQIKLPEKMYAVGSFCGWQPANSSEMIPVNGQEGKFWGIYYFDAGTEFKFNTANGQDQWVDDFGGDTDDSQEYGATLTGGGKNIKIKTAGFYEVVLTCTINGSSIDKKIELIEPKVYIIGDCAAGKWDAQLTDNDLFTIQGDQFVSPVLSHNGDLRMCIKLEGYDWWKTEFNIFDGAIVYRGAEGDQAKVPAQAGQTVKLNFKTNTGSIE